jgi:hypothetical protein
MLNCERTVSSMRSAAARALSTAVGVRAGDSSRSRHELGRSNVDSLVDDEYNSGLGLLSLARDSCGEPDNIDIDDVGGGDEDDDDDDDEAVDDDSAGTDCDTVARTGAVAGCGTK